MRRELVAVIFVGLMASAETKCEDCWTDQCKELKAYFKKSPRVLLASEFCLSDCCFPARERSDRAAPFREILHPS